MKIVALHGWGENREFWDAFAGSFQKGEVIVFDLPGFGSEPLADPYWGIPEYGEWVRTKIEDLRESDIVLLGHSFGGRIASYVASQNPDWLAGLVLYGAPSLRRPTLSIRLQIAAAKTLKKLGFRGKGRNPELREADQKGMGKIFRKSVSFDQTALLPKIKSPTLIVWGERDTTVPLRIGREMNRLIPGSKLVMINGAGHNAHLENPTLFYGTIKNFIRGL